MSTGAIAKTTQERLNRGDLQALPAGWQCDHMSYADNTQGDLCKDPRQAAQVLYQQWYSPSPVPSQPYLEFDNELRYSNSIESGESGYEKVYYKVYDRNVNGRLDTGDKLSVSLGEGRGIVDLLIDDQAKEKWRPVHIIESTDAIEAIKALRRRGDFVTHITIAYQSALQAAGFTLEVD